MSEGVLQWVSLDDVSLPEDLLRPKDPALIDVSDLLPSVERDGILQPLLGRPLPDGKIELISGYRRLVCATQLGIDPVPFYVRKMDDEGAAIAELVENIARRDLPPHREAEATLRILAYELNMPVDEVPNLIYRYLNYAKGLTGNAPSDEEVTILEGVFERIGRKPSYFATDILPALKWPEPVLKAIEEGKINRSAAKALRKIENEELLGQAVERVVAGEPAREVVRDILGGASDSKDVSRLQKKSDELEGWELNEEGYIVPPPASMLPEATYYEALERPYLVREVLALLGWEGKKLALLHPDDVDVQRALEAGCPTLWVDSSKPSEMGHQLGSVELPDNVIAFARIHEDRAAKWGDQNENDPTGEDVPVEEAVKYYNRFPVVVARLEYAHLFERRIDFVAINENMTVHAVML